MGLSGLRAGKLAVTEHKKAELDGLSNDVFNAQNVVTRLQALVDALTLKSNVYGGFLIEAQTAYDRALANKLVARQVVNQVLDLLNNSDIAFNEMILADAETKELAKAMKQLMDKIIYCVEVINKLSNVVVRKKAQNPLISDDLMAVINQAGNEANNAVALTLVALQSTFAAQTSNLESEADATLELSQAMWLYESMVGIKETTKMSTEVMYGVPLSFDEKGPHNETCLWSLFVRAYNAAEDHYNHAKKANNEVSKELALATANLSTAQVNLRSLQLSLAAANAAALAS